MTAALHHLRIYRIRSSILTKFAGPNARVPTSEEVQSTLWELDQWRQDAPRKEKSNHFPQQNADRIHTNYLQAVLLLIRPILVNRPTNFDSIKLCVTFAADACESAKALSLNPLTLPDRITVYHSFYAGITLLQCLAIKPNSLTLRGSHKAISACSSALAVYTRVLPSVAPFLRLFEDVANKVVRDDHDTEFSPSPEVQSLLSRIISSDPSEIPSILQSLSEGDNQENVFAWATGVQTEGETTEVFQFIGSFITKLILFPKPIQYESILGGQSLVAPLNMPLGISPLYVSDTEMMDIWTTSWLSGISTEFCGGSSLF
ncbi:hypothetical protein N7481_002830 [Penicillium waksmanii]|uniref:uncharacterized protein n=1 Tax=Penicillium waksmanii TaxID=69791 RepID=UPI002547B60E|nr:uncharacterized protein N7481_002830 [Penicillium waksmanii]KAJ5995853.1 hypothetical protein N7481_002830 [Penicillium waksmanii]